MNEHIGHKAAFLASLAPSDPERKNAEDHAAACASCGDALAEGQRLVRLVREVLPPPSPTPEAMARAALAIEHETAREHRVARAFGWAIGGAVAAGWILQVALGYGRFLQKGAGRIALSAGVLAVAIASATFMRRRRRLAVGVLIGTSGLLAYGAAAIPAFEPRIGAACTAYELAAASIPWVVASLVEGTLALSGWDMMAYAAAGALASQAAQHLTCPVAHADTHLLVFHFGGVVLAVILGAGLRIVKTPFRPRHLPSG